MSVRPGRQRRVTSCSIDFSKQPRGVKLQHVRDLEKLDDIEPALSSLELRHERLGPLQFLGEARLRQASTSARACQHLS